MKFLSIFSKDSRLAISVFISVLFAFYKMETAYLSSMDECVKKMWSMCTMDF